MRILSLLLLLLLLFHKVIFAAQDTPKEHLFIVSGVIVNSESSKKIAHFINMIAQKSGYLLKPFYVDSYTRLSKVLRENPDALAWTCGVPYVEDSIKDQQQLIAVPLFNGVPTYSSFIVTRRDNSGKKLLDFKAKILAYSDHRSNSGYVAPSVLLKNGGEDMADFFKVKIHTGTHEKSIEAIYRGIADVGAIDEYVWVEYIKNKPDIAKKLHVIEKSGPFPFTPIVAAKGVPKEMVEKIRIALTNMTQAENLRFRNDFKLDGFVSKPPQFFNPIKDNMSYIGIKL